jgi:hypothetical protein
LSALPAEIGEIVARVDTGRVLLSAPEPHLFSQAPERPDKPPNFLLFV